jgi:hypothetical protein
MGLVSLYSSVKGADELLTGGLGPYWFLVPVCRGQDSRRRLGSPTHISYKFLPGMEVNSRDSLPPTITELLFLL